MKPSTKRGQVATARTVGRDASSTRPPKARIRVLIADDHGIEIGLAGRQKGFEVPGTRLHVVGEDSTS